MVHPKPFLDPASGDPLKMSLPKGKKLRPERSSTIVLNFTPISGTSAEISVTGQK